jgi:hypothetical protein
MGSNFFTLNVHSLKKSNKKVANALAINGT